jgi:hypothetical protein
MGINQNIWRRPGSWRNSRLSHPSKLEAQLDGIPESLQRDLARRGRYPGRDGEGHRSRVALSGRFWG